MKKKLTLSLTLLATAIVFSSYLTSKPVNQNSNEKGPIYDLNIDSSSVNWIRHLDQGPTQQKILMFGSEVLMNYSEMQVTSSGVATLTDGRIIMKQSVIDTIIFNLDIKSIKMAKETKNGLFNEIKYPNATVIITELKQSGEQYVGTGQVIIEGISKNYSVTLTYAILNQSIHVNSHFSINSLDFPLRSQQGTDAVNTDTIKVQFMGLFQQ